MRTFTVGPSSNSPSSFASSSRLPLASLMAPRAVRYCLACSASASMFSVLCWRSRSCSRRLSACATSAAFSAMRSLAGRWLALWRRIAASETSNNDATERFDASPTRARSMVSLSGCSQTVQLRGIVRLLAVVGEPVARRPHPLGVVPPKAVVRIKAGRPCHLSSTLPLSLVLLFFLSCVSLKPKQIPIGLERSRAKFRPVTDGSRETQAKPQHDSSSRCASRLAPKTLPQLLLHGALEGVRMLLLYLFETLLEGRPPREGAVLIEACLDVATGLV